MKLAWQMRNDRAEWWPSDTNFHDQAGDTAGVYVIACKRGEILYIGQGQIADRLANHRKSLRHIEWRATWAEVPKPERVGVESYLAEVLRPKRSWHFPTAKARQTEVNLPPPLFPSLFRRDHLDSRR